MGTLRVRNLAQKVLWEQELSGQISDGHWENASPHDHWEAWCDAKVVVDPENVGRDFWARRESYNFTSKDLLDVVGDRMVEAVRVATGNAEYDMAAMRKDLNDLKTIIKQHVSSSVPVPKQPRSYKAKLIVDGYAQDYTVYVPTADDPRAVDVLEKREREARAYRIKQLEKKLGEAQRVVEKIEAELLTEREAEGMLPIA